MSESQPPAAAWSESSGDIRVSEVDGLPRVVANGGGHSSVDVYDDDSGDVSAPGSMLRAALDLVELGYPVFPVFGVGRAACLCGRPACENQGKHPMVEWREAASASASNIEATWKRSPEANIGLPCGVETGLVALDVDHDSGRAALAEYERKHGALPDTVRALTGGGNDHYLFEHPGGYIKTTVGRPAMDGQGARGLGFVGLDSRADGGYIVAPSSLHVSGRRYRWYPGRELGAYPLAPLPQWIADLLRPSEPAERSAGNYMPPRLVSIDPYLRAAVECECTNVVRTAKGGRNDQLNVSAFNLGLLVAGGELAGEVVRQSMLSAALSAGLGEREARNTIESALAGARKKDPRRVPALPLRRPSAAVGGEPAAGSAGSAETSFATRGGIEVIGASEIFAPLPPTRWVVKDLQIGPGRPAMFVGFGGDGKTFAAQALGLAKASGMDIWGRFATTPGIVLHLDYEQGRHGTSKRYQRLARGHGITAEQTAGRLFVGVLPRVYLDDRDAADRFVARFEGVDLVIIDALRGAAPESDENDSSIRKTLDLLTYASEQTGTTCIMLHHSAKGERDDKRMMGRGSGAIFDACGCVLVFEPGKGNGPKRISQQKQPTESEGPKLAPFTLCIEDVASEIDPHAGVRVAWGAATPEDPGAKAAAAYERDAERMLAAVRANNGRSGNIISEKCGVQRTRALAVLNALVDESKLTTTIGPRNTKQYHLTGKER